MAGDGLPNASDIDITDVAPEPEVERAPDAPAETVEATDTLEP